MCNNMLQFGHFYAFGKENKIDVCGLRFCYKYLYFEISNQRKYNWLTYVLAKYISKLGLMPKVNFDNELEIFQNKLVLLNNKTVFVTGWLFREYDLFLKYQDEIRALFAFKKSLIDSVKENELLKSDKLKLGLHIRRGDYKKWQNGKFFYSDHDYIYLIKSFLSHVNASVDLVIVTNDKEIAKVLYVNQLSSINVHFINANQAQDLYMLSICDYIIGPPSTFSLIASFYQKKPIYWIYDKEKEITASVFSDFNFYFRNII